MKKTMLARDWHKKSDAFCLGNTPSRPDPMLVEGV